MAFETKNFFNSTIKQIYQQTGAILSLSSRSDKQLLINSLKLFEANFVYNWQKILYPLLHGPTGSPYEKYTGMRSKPWAEYDALDPVYGGMSGWTLTAEPWATEDSIPALWDETNKQPHSITGALYYLSQRIEDLTVENDEAELPQYDDREVKADIDCLEKNLESIYKDVYGCGYTLDCDGGKQNQFSVQTHLFQIFDQLIDGGPQFSIDDSCEDLYPAMSIYMPTSGLTYDVKIPNTEVDGICGNSLQDDLNLIHSYIGLNNCETSPTYSDYGTLNYLTDGNSLEESLWDLDNAIGSFSATKTLLEAYKDGWLDTGNYNPGLIQIKDNANKANASEGLKIVHPRTDSNWSNPSSLVMINNNLGTVFEDDLLEVKDEAISGSDYVVNPLTNRFSSPDIDRWFKHTTIGEHEVGRKAQVALPNPAKYGDFIYPSFHIYRSIFNQMPTSGIPRTRASTQAYEGYTSYQINETAIWVATGLNRDGDSWTTVPEAGKPYDCDGNLVSENNLYYREPGDGTIYLLNKCGMTVQTTSNQSTFTWGEDAPKGAAAFQGLDGNSNNVYHNSDLMFVNPDGNGLTIGWGGSTDTADDAGAVTANTLVVQEHNQGDINQASIEIRSRNTGSKEVISFTHGNFGSINENASIATSATGDFEFIANGDTRDIVFKPDDSESLRLYANGNAMFSGGVIVSGGLVVNGTTTTINSTTLQVDDKNIELGTVDTPTDTTADGGGITLKAASDKTITWSSATNAWTSNVGLHSNGPLSTNGALTVTGAISTQSTIKLGGEANDEGKIRYNATSNEFEGHDGTSWGSLGGSGSGINSIVEDTTPQLGGNLDLNSSDITGTGNIDITGDVTATLVKSNLEGAIHFNAQAGENLLKGEVVYVSGLSGNTPIVMKARANSSTTMPAFGIASEDINLNNTGNITTLGTETGLDVSDFGETGISFSLGDTLYISSSEAGKITNVAPAGESNFIQNIGKIERATPTTNISIKVGGAGRSNATPALNDGNIFIGDSNNRSVTSNLQSLVESYSINNVVEDTTPQLGGDLDIYNGSNSFGFKDSSSADVSPFYSFYGKDAVGAGSDRPAKLRLHGGGSTSNSVGINVDFNISSDYDIRLPSGPGAMGQVLKITSTTGASVLSWVDECCAPSATTSSEGTVILTNGSSPVDNSNDDDAVITVAATANIPLTRFSTTGFTLGASDVTGLSSVATSGAYSDLTGAPSLATIATSGSYSDLTGTPNLIGGTGVDISVSGSDYTFNADLTELSAYAGTPNNFVITAGTSSRLIAPGSIDISIFNNDAGYVTTDTNTFRTVQVDGSAIGSTETLNLEAGTNVTLTESGGTVTIAASGGSSVRTIVAGGNTLDSSETLTLTGGSNINITESNGTVTITATDTNTQLSNEQVQDIVGGMLSGNTESGITVTYDDNSNEIDFTVTAGSTFVDDVNITSSDYTTSGSDYYSHATYFVYWTGDGPNNDFIIENVEGYSVGSVIKIINVESSAFTIRTQKQGSNQNKLVNITSSGPGTATSSFSLAGNRAVEFIVNSSGNLFYK